jgi:acetyltransferase-like isoleucine patch superfamily enzyme
VTTFTSTQILKFMIRPVRYPRLAVASLMERTKRAKCVAHNTVRLLPGSSIVNSLGCKDRIEIGPHTVSRGECRVLHPTGSIKIGSYCYIGDHTRIWSAVGVTIGNQVLIAHSVNIHDNDSHPKSASRRHLQTVEIFSGPDFDMTDVAMAPIIIEDDVWIGFNAAIMKGVTVGRGAIVGAAAVITKDVPPFAIMAGNPARQVGISSE